MIAEDTLVIYSLQNTADAGAMPVEQLVEVSTEFFEDRTIGYGRNYAALGVNQQIDRLVRIWRNNAVTTKHYVVIDGDQYRVDFVQHTTDEDGLKITDLTLVRLDDNFDVEEATG